MELKSVFKKGRIVELALGAKGGITKKVLRKGEKREEEIEYVGLEGRKDGREKEGRE